MTTDHLAFPVLRGTGGKKTAVPPHSTLVTSKGLHKNSKERNSTTVDNVVQQ